jgi:hypothetical protein
VRVGEFLLVYGTIRVEVQHAKQLARQPHNLRDSLVILSRCRASPLGTARRIGQTPPVAPASELIASPKPVATYRRVVRHCGGGERLDELIERLVALGLV